MNSTVKVLIFLLLAGIISCSSAEQDKTVNDEIFVPDSLLSKDSAAVKDTSLLRDSVTVKPVNKDSAAAQDSLSLMKKKFDQFKYVEVVTMANKLLLKKVPFTKADILGIYKLKGISHYSLSEDDAAKKSFIEILRIDTSYTLDSTKISPKIISFYNQVKQNYIQQQKEIEANTVVRIDTVYVPKIEYDAEHEWKLKNAIARSLIVPGLGHLYLESSFKSVVLTVLGSASLVSSIYYFIRTEDKENKYLVETDPVMIESRYNEYNDSYKKRNISMIAYGVLWLYSQIDLLFFSDNDTSKSVISNSTIGYNDLRGLTLNFRYSF
ncbi:MAG TPA: hypothetical protein VI230_01450 [Ignavibacteriaceae bacterium]